MSTKPGTLSFTYDQAVDALKEAVKVRGEDFHYQEHFGDDCKNFDEGGRPCCIAGYVYAALGADEAFRARNTTYSVSYLAGTGELQVDESTRRLLQYAQTEQDSGAPWGDAVQNALACMK